jgi:ferric-dicitrate binding protein FerR (iron transport regulator)
VLTVIEGSTRVEGKESQVIVRKGQRTQIKEGRASKPMSVLDLVRSVDWADEILILKGRESPELFRRVEDILAQIGEAKMQLLKEEDIRRLGDHCVVPLTRFIESERSRGEKEKRHRAALLIADLAQPWSIPDLIDLLKDSDGEVRYQAARGLKRLTHLTFGAEPEQWRNRSPQAQKAHQEWRAWWRENEYRYPKPPS